MQVRVLPSASMRRRIPLPALLLAATLAGTAPACQLALSPQEQGTGATLDGVVEFVDTGGGCWTIRVNPNVRYLPINLPTQFRHDSLAVRIEIAPRDDIKTACKVDHVVELRSIHTR